MAARGRSDVYVVAGREFDRVIRELRQSSNHGLSSDLRKQIRVIVKPIVQEVKGKIRGMPIKGTPGGTKQHPRRRGANGIRRTIARGVGVKQRIGGKGNPRVRITTSVPEKELAALPRGLDAYKGSARQGFRHPVYGRDQWVDQHGVPWFREPIEDRKEDVQRAVLRAVDKTLDRISDKGK